MHFQEDHKIIFKNNNFWLFIDFEYQDQIELPVSNNALRNHKEIKNHEEFFMSKRNNPHFILSAFIQIPITQSDRQEWLSTLDMLPISEAIYAKSYGNGSDLIIDWILFDVYKIASDFPLEVSVYGYIFNENITIDEESEQSAITPRFRLADKFLSKSTRDDLRGLRLKCGLVVCISFFFLQITSLQTLYSI